MRLNALISLHYREFTDNELIVCRHILSHLDDCSAMTVGEVARACHVSNALVTRFAKKLGFSGFSELKAYLRLEEPLRSIPPHALVAHATDSYRHVIETVLGHDFSALFNQLLAAERVVICGGSASMQNAAREAKRIFMPLVEMVEVQGVERCRSLCPLGKTSVCLLLVDSGDDPVLASLVQALKTQGAYVFCVSSMSNGECALLADDAIFVATTRVVTPSDTAFESVAPHLLALELMFLALRLYVSR